MTRYAALLAALDDIPKAIIRTRNRHNLSGAAAARQIGIERTALLRLERGRPYTPGTMRKILAWLDQHETRRSA